MKSRTTKIKSLIIAGAALTLTMVLVVGSPAMAGKPRVADSALGQAMGSSADLQRLSEIADSLGDIQVIPGAAEAAFPEDDPTPIPDGGDWEPVFPEDDPTPIPDGGDWEPVFPEDDPTPIPDGGDWEPVFPEDDPAPADEADDATDTEVPDEPSEVDETDVVETPDESADDVTEQEPQSEQAQADNDQADDEATALPFTGGNSTPWLIAGAVVIGLGAGMLLRRRPRHEGR